MESAVHWSKQTGTGGQHELNDGAPPFKVAFEKIEQCSREWREILDDMSIPFEGHHFPNSESQ